MLFRLISCGIILAITAAISFQRKKTGKPFEAVGFAGLLIALASFIITDIDEGPETQTDITTQTSIIVSGEHATVF